MSRDKLDLGKGFEPRTDQEWRDFAETSLKGKPLAKLTRQTHDGLKIAPLYSQTQDLGPDAAGLPGQSPFVRGAQAAPAQPLGWRMASAYGEADLGQLQATIMQDLEGGVGAVHLGLDLAARTGQPEDSAMAHDGAPVYDLAELSQVLHGVDDSLAPVLINGGASFMGSAALLAALWRQRGRDLSTLQGSLNADPLGALARQGTLLDSTQGALESLGNLACWANENTPHVKAARVSAEPYHDAGATGALELACVLATSVAYLRAMVQAGLSVDAAARQIELSLTLGARFFFDVAKLRAARRLWARAQQAVGINEPTMSLHGVSSNRMMTRRDPWVSMLRGTAACFAGAAGGAQSIRIAAFDSVHQTPGTLGRRVARNTQVILQEESQLGRVMDPAGGSWFIENLTDQLARAAWAEFQAIESEGGMAAVLESGWLAQRLEAGWGQRCKDLAKRKISITGVNEFPNLHEGPAEGAPVDLPAVKEATERRHAARTEVPFVRPAEQAFEGAIEAASAGASVFSLAKAFSGERPAKIAALPQHRDAQAFEALRDASDAQLDASGRRPRVLLVNLGKVAEHTGRATWAKNFFEVGGIEAVGNDGFATPEEAVAGLKECGAQVAVLCGTDGLYESEVGRFAPALLAAGVQKLFLAGRPGERQSQYEDAGVQGFIYVGCDVLGTLQETLSGLGMWS